MKHRIIVIDDVEVNRAEVNQALVLAFGDRGEIVSFKPGAGNLTNGTNEERLAADLKASPNSPASLIVADRDLSNPALQYGGLSEPVVRGVADVLGIPECGYARGESNLEKIYLEDGEQAEASIRLALIPQQDFAKQVLSIADGFAQILTKIPAAMASGAQNSPAKVLANILGKPEYADKISLYASGDRNRLAALSRVRREKNETEQQRRLACFFGYWLWDSILRFPGVVVNEIAASSYLNIKHGDFLRDEVQIPFAAARYEGPFAEAKGKMWWRGMLDDIVSDNDCSDGLELVAKRGVGGVSRSECCEDTSKPALYYCMFTRRPVSLENSVSGLSWFPRGADLARISRSANAEYSPWLTA